MKMKPLLRYQLWDTLRPLIGFYLALIVLPYLLDPVTMLITGSLADNPGWFGSWISYLLPEITGSLVHGSGYFLYLDYYISFFIFLLGLFSFSSSYKMGQCCCVPRRTIFLSHLARTAIVSGVIGLFSTIYAFLITFVNRTIFPAYIVFFTNYYGATVSRSYEPDSNLGAVIRSPQFLIEYFLWTFFLCAMLFMLGYLINLCAYRLREHSKRIITFTIPGIVLALLAYCAAVLVPVSSVSHGLTGIFMLKSRMFDPLEIFGLNFTLNPDHYTVLYLILFAIFGGLSYLLIRRASVRR